MDAWLLVLLTSSLCAALTVLLRRLKKKPRLPPGPIVVPFVGNLLWLTHSISNFEALLRDIHAQYGPIVTLCIGSRYNIFISDRRLAHEALVGHGVTFADRPKPSPKSPLVRLFGDGQHLITGAQYGPLWRLLRRNLISETLHPSRVKLFAEARTWALRVLTSKLRAGSGDDAAGAVVMESFVYTMFCLLVFMCFGEKLDEEAVKSIEVAQRDILLYARNLRVLTFFPTTGKYLFRERWKKALRMQQRRKEIYSPLISARRQHKDQKQDTEKRFAHSYLDTLLDVELPDEGSRNLTDNELVALCSEFLNAGTDTTSTALEWIMAELVKHQDIQQKLFEEIKNAVGANVDEEVKEEDLQKLPYLRAVIMEGLRRHPPGHMVLPHAVSEDVSIGGYVVPKGATVNFMVARMGRDEEVWEDAMEFKPERFLETGSGYGVDITGNREIKMMPFGVGRRICPGVGLAMLHLEYFVANLVREFEWKGVEGEEVDLSEKAAFTVVMKNPLRARVIPRTNK